MPLLTDEVRAWTIARTESSAVKQGGHVLACNAMPDHIHLLAALPPTACVSTFIGRVKGETAYAFNREFHPRHHLQWQDGYGVVAFRATEIEHVIRYITDQQVIHARRALSRLLETTEREEPTPSPRP